MFPESSFWVRDWNGPCWDLEASWEEWDAYKSPQNGEKNLNNVNLELITRRLPFKLFLENLLSHS